MLAVMVNCALMGMSDLADRLFPGYSTTQRLLGVVILEVSGAAPDLADPLFPGYSTTQRLLGVVILEVSDVARLDLALGFL